MKQLNFKMQLICITAIILLFTACEKKEPANPEPPKPPADTVLTEEKLIGKWEAVYCHVQYFDAGRQTTSYETTKGEGYVEDGFPKYDWIAEEHTTTMEFAADHHFSHYQPNGDPKGYVLRYALQPTGKWNIQNQETIRLIETENDTIFFDGLWKYAYLNSKLNLLYYEADTTGKTQQSMQILIELEKQ